MDRIVLLKKFTESCEISSHKSQGRRYPMELVYFAPRDYPIEYPRMVQSRYRGVLEVMRKLFPADAFEKVPSTRKYYFNAGSMLDAYATVELTIAQAGNTKVFTFNPKTGGMIKRTKSGFYMNSLYPTHPEQLAWHSVTQWLPEADQ